MQVAAYVEGCKLRQHVRYEPDLSLQARRQGPQVLMPPQRQAKTLAAARIRKGRLAAKREALSPEQALADKQSRVKRERDLSQSPRNVKTETKTYTRDAISDDVFGLIQERYQHNLYHLVVQAILWNQTRGKQARIVLEELLERYPDPQALANADERDLEELLYPIGLYKQRAKRLKALGQAWIERPPCKEQRYTARAKGYDAGDDQDPGWEIAHLPGVGPYALDSYRIFHRDQLRGLASSWQAEPEVQSTRIKREVEDARIEPEWKRVVPLDKDLRAFLIWAWAREGYKWDPHTGKKVRIKQDL